MERTRQLADQRGASIVEFIIVLPFLLLVFFAIVELSRAWLTFNIVTSAAREGARIGVVTDPFDPTPAVNRINAILSSANLTPTSVSVVCAAPCAADSPVTANVSVTFQTVVPGILPAVLGSLTLTQSATMRYE